MVAYRSLDTMLTRNPASRPPSSLVPAALAADDAPKAGGPFYVCEAGIKDHVGTYKAKGHQDGVPKYTNENGMSIFRHNGYWYMGDLRPWPPVASAPVPPSPSASASSPPGPP